MPEPPEKRPDETRDRKPDGEYDVVSTDMHGEPSHEQVEAKSVTDLVENLRSKGLQVSSVTGPRARRAFEPRKSDPEDFAFFNAELANACRNGMPLPGALRALSRDMSGRRCRPRARRDVQRLGRPCGRRRLRDHEPCSVGTFRCCPTSRPLSVGTFRRCPTSRPRSVGTFGCCPTSGLQRTARPEGPQALLPRLHRPREG